MIKLIGLSGSLRKQSYNTALLRAAASVLPTGASLEVQTIEGIPLYNEDVEDTLGVPAVVSALKDAIAAADGLVLSTPEYNNSIPGAFKNAIDWLSRPNDDIARVFRGKPVAVMGVSAGPFGTVLSQAAWWPILRTLGTDPYWGDRLLVGKGGQVFGENGELLDAHTREHLKKFVGSFITFAAARVRK